MNDARVEKLEEKFVDNSADFPSAVREFVPDLLVYLLPGKRSDLDSALREADRLRRGEYLPERVTDEQFKRIARRLV